MLQTHFGKLVRCTMQRIHSWSIEGFRRVQEEHIAISFFLDGLHEGFVEVNQMVGALDSTEKSVLSGVDEGLDRGHDSVRDSSCKDPVVCIGYRQRPCVVN